MSFPIRTRLHYDAGERGLKPVHPTALVVAHLEWNSNPKAHVYSTPYSTQLSVFIDSNEQPILKPCY